MSSFSLLPPTPITDSEDDGESEAAKQLIQPIAEKIIAKYKAKEEEAPLLFFVAGEVSVEDRPGWRPDQAGSGDLQNMSDLGFWRSEGISGSELIVPHTDVRGKGVSLVIRNHFLSLLYPPDLPSHSAALGMLGNPARSVPHALLGEQQHRRQPASLTPIHSAGSEPGPSALQSISLASPTVPACNTGLAITQS